MTGRCRMLLGRPMLITSGPSLNVLNDYFLHYISLPDLIDHIQPFVNFAKDSVLAVEVFGVFPVVANKELGSARISPSVRHREHSAVVVLMVTVQFTINFVTGTAVADTVRAAALDHEIGDHPVKNKSVVKMMLCEVNKIFHGVGRILVKEFDFHDTLLRVNFSDFHDLRFEGAK